MSIEGNRCTAHNRRGERCGRRPHPGSRVCVMHGAKAPQARAKAAYRVGFAEELARNPRRHPTEVLRDYGHTLDVLGKKITASIGDDPGAIPGLLDGLMTVIDSFQRVAAQLARDPVATLSDEQLFALVEDRLRGYEDRLAEADAKTREAYGAAEDVPVWDVSVGSFVRRVPAGYKAITHDAWIDAQHREEADVQARAFPADQVVPRVQLALEAARVAPGAEEAWWAGLDATGGLTTPLVRAMFAAVVALVAGGQWQPRELPPGDGEVRES